MRERLFQAFDRDGNGLIDFEEFSAGMSIFRDAVPENKVNFLFELYNLDGDSGVSRQELYAVLKTTVASVQRIRHELTRHRSGDTSAAVYDVEYELLDAQVHDVVQEAFISCDLTQNGVLSRSEFAAWVKQHPTLIDSVFNQPCFRDQFKVAARMLSHSPAETVDQAHLARRPTNNTVQTWVDDVCPPPSRHDGEKGVGAARPLFHTSASSSKGLDISSTILCRSSKLPRNHSQIAPSPSLNAAALHPTVRCCVDLCFFTGLTLFLFVAGQALYEAPF